eukprot:15460765-Alexandrium_andersonii.AAC.1
MLRGLATAGNTALPCWRARACPPLSTEACIGFTADMLSFVLSSCPFCNTMHHVVHEPIGLKGLAHMLAGFCKPRQFLP